MKMERVATLIYCHRLPERCFQFRNKPMPFCARCLGACIGHMVSLILLLFNSLPSLKICILFMLIILLDWSLQQWFNISSTNYRRLITGILGGIGVGSAIWYFLGIIIKQIIFPFFLATF